MLLKKMFDLYDQMILYTQLFLLSKNSFLLIFLLLLQQTPNLFPKRISQRGYANAKQDLK